MAYNVFPLCFNSFQAKPMAMGYQNGLNDGECLNKKKNGQETISTAKKQYTDA